MSRVAMAGGVVAIALIVLVLYTTWRWMRFRGSRWRVERVSITSLPRLAFHHSHHASQLGVKIPSGSRGKLWQARCIGSSDGMITASGDRSNH
jgi:hypothetical protein